MRIVYRAGGTKWGRRRSGGATGAAAVFLLLFGCTASTWAQSTGAIAGRVLSSGSNEPIAAATIHVVGTNFGATAGADGAYRVAGVPEGRHTLRVLALGYETVSQEVTVTAGETVQAQIELSINPVQLHGLRVSVLAPHLTPQARLEQREIREANSLDSGDLLRRVPGVEAVRRGAMNLDPVVRGLRETEVGTYLDGARLFPAGPCRMDTPLAHADPTTYQAIEVVKGPYALTWGAGNLSAIRAVTQTLPPGVPGAAHGRLFTGFDANRNAVEAGGSVIGQSGNVSYSGHTVFRDGSDYESGSGEIVPGQFRSWEIRGKASVNLAESSDLWLSGAYQDQGPIDYAGKLMNADWFHAANLSAGWKLDWPARTVQGIDVVAYLSDVDHEMSNRDKPSAETRTAKVNSGVWNVGGRAAAHLNLGQGWTLEAGGDGYLANRNATRRVERLSDGHVMLEDKPWPDATISDVGLFAKAERPFGRVNLAGTVRLDFVHANADSVSEFYLENTTGDIESNETNFSAAFTVGYNLSANWVASLGLGSAVRTADAKERYSDRYPSTKSQMANEFLGNPALQPERSTQADLWVEGAYTRVSYLANFFARKIKDYITLEATDLPPKQPSSPEPVYQYVNGDATFWGFESSFAYALFRPLTTSIGAAYLWGQDDKLDEPAIGVAPFTGWVSVRWDDLEDLFYVETKFNWATEQTRVATTRNEMQTDGWATFDVHGGVKILQWFELRLGIDNLTDAEYVNHLSVRNPYTGARIPEPGRTFYGNLAFMF